MLSVAQALAQPDDIPSYMVTQITTAQHTTHAQRATSVATRTSESGTP